MTRTEAIAARNMHSDADWSLDIRRADALRLTGEKVREVAATLPPALAAKADICIAAADKAAREHAATLNAKQEQAVGRTTMDLRGELVAVALKAASASLK